MEYVFFLLLTFTFIMLITYKKNKKPLVFLLLLFLSLLIIYPDASIKGAKEGINLWLFVVIPSLIPFFIVNDMLISVKVPENIARLFAPTVKLLFNTSGYGAYAFIMSIFSGYPAGAKIVSDLIRDKKITPLEGQKILTFSSTSGPLFIIGAVGSGMMKSSITGYVLYISHVIGAVINGILFRLIINQDDNKSFYNSKDESSFFETSEILSKAVLNSLYTSAIIGGYITLFSVVIYLFREIQYFKILSLILQKYSHLSANITSSITSLLETSLEISNGAKIISLMEEAYITKLMYFSFIIAFSGISIIGQVSGVVNRTGINMKFYIISKISHGILSSLVCRLILGIANINVSTFANSNFSPILSIPICFDVLLLIILLFNYLGYSRNKMQR